MKYRLAQLGVLLVAAAFLGYWALLVYCDVWRPIPLGLFLSFDADRVIVVDTVAGGPAQRAGLRAGDRIAAVRWPSDRQPPGLDDGRSQPRDRPADALGRRSRRRGIGGADHARARLVAVVAHHGRVRRCSWCALTQLVALLLGVLVAFKRSRDPTALVGSAFLATIGVFSLTLPYRFASVWRALPLPARPAAVDSVHQQRGDCRVGVFVFRDLSARALSHAAWRGARSGFRSCPVWSARRCSATTPSSCGQPAPPLPPWTQSLVVGRRRLPRRRAGGARAELPPADRCQRATAGPGGDDRVARRRDRRHAGRAVVLEQFDERRSINRFSRRRSPRRARSCSWCCRCRSPTPSCGIGCSTSA